MTTARDKATPGDNFKGKEAIETTLERVSMESSALLPQSILRAVWDHWEKEQQCPLQPVCHLNHSADNVLSREHCAGCGTDRDKRDSPVVKGWSEQPG